MKARTYRGVVVGGILIAGLALAGVDAVPELADGFCGKIRGVVVEKDGDTSVVLKVNRVFKVSSENKAKIPNRLTGLTIKVVLQEGGKDLADLESEKEYIRGLNVGDRILMEIRHSSGAKHFEIVNLSKAKEQNGTDSDMATPLGHNELELRAEIKKLQKRIAELEEENRTLRQQISDLKMRM